MLSSVTSEFVHTSLAGVTLVTQVASPLVDYDITGFYPQVGTASQMTHVPLHESHGQAAQRAVGSALPDAVGPEGVLGADSLHTTILDNCTDAIVAHTLDGTLLYANPAALEQWRCSSIVDVRARGPWGWIPEEQRPRIAGRMGRIRAHGEAQFNSISRMCTGESMSAEVHAQIGRASWRERV